MSFISALFRAKPAEPPFDPNPDIAREMPARPYLVLHADLPFYSDPDCKNEVADARLIIVRSEDPAQDHHPIECVPTRKRYVKGQTLRWEINHKRQWAEAWYVDPETGNKEKAWARAVEFLGLVVMV